MTASVLRQAFLQLPATEQASLLDELIIDSCDAAWEARLAGEMEDRVDAVEHGEMKLHSASDVLTELRGMSRA
ncbi:hypothetical protein [Prosthecobacter vanneervenii]|uniref:Addiction module component n=1 Tax=Prosthecobacter vanneervenii TaxID=48466 RepID=A0A7W7YEV2_9BACT|nr:hypothetical protein [Prosthecobacter vanneervenii]MBB5034737.1 hypothetical protein [Prosthecobacter vanneervenii]